MQQNNLNGLIEVHYNTLVEDFEDIFEEIDALNMTQFKTDFDKLISNTVLDIGKVSNLFGFRRLVLTAIERTRCAQLNIYVYNFYKECNVKEKDNDFGHVEPQKVIEVGLRFGQSQTRT